MLAASGLPADKCDVHKQMLGGGFGRRGAFHDYVTQAVLHRQADARDAGEAALVARRGHAARRVSPDHAMQAESAAFDEDNNLTGMHMRAFPASRS